MVNLLEKKLEHWEHELLDLGKRNKMINYKESKRTTMKLTSPDFNELWERIALNEEELTFKRPVDRNSDLRIFSMLTLLEILSQPIPVTKGDIDTDISFIERQKTLKNLRAKSKLSLDEQGNNILYMTVGFVEWRDDISANGSWIKSPLIMVPVSLVLESVNTPYVLKRYEDDIVVNPTLAYYWNEKYGITLPLFDSDEQGIDEFMQQLEKLVDKRGWKIIREISLGLLSFLKINMYYDIQNNREKLLNHPILKAITGEKSENPEFDIQNFDHDSILPINSYQVVNADSSQQDAVILSQKGVSFVIQGPPGTGKSQTITNIIATALADDKKVLFVSEKNAALQVVYRRLQEVNLADFCLPLHSHKANKREILGQIGDTLNLPVYPVKDEAITKLYTLNTERERLNLYARGLHVLVAPLNESIYSGYAVLSGLAENSDVKFTIENIESVTKEKLETMHYCVSEYASALTKMGCHYSENPWKGTNINTVTHSLIEKIQNVFSTVIEITEALANESELLRRSYDFSYLNRFSDVDSVKSILKVALKAVNVPVEWLISESINVLKTEAEQRLNASKQYFEKQDVIAKCYSPGVFSLAAKTLQEQISKYRIKLSLTAVPQKIANERDIKNTYLEMHLIYEKLCKTVTAVELIQRTTDYIQPITYSNLKDYSDFVLLLCKTPKINEMWLSVYDFDGLVTICNETKGLWSDILCLKSYIGQKSKCSIFELSDKSMFEQFVTYSDFVDSTSPNIGLQNPKHLTLEALSRYSERLSDDLNLLDQLWTTILQESNFLYNNHGFTKFNLRAEIQTQIRICEAALCPFFPLECWADISNGTKPYELLHLAEHHHKTLSKLKTEILSIYENSVFNLDSDAMLKRFKTEYRSILKWIKSSYHSDRKEIYAIHKNVSSKITDNEIVILLQNLSVSKESDDWLANNKETILSIIDNHYTGDETDFELLYLNIERFKKVAPLFRNNSDAVRAMSIKSDESISVVRSYQSHLHQLNEFCSKQPDVIDDISKYINDLKLSLSKVTELKTLFDVALGYVNDKNMDYNSLVEFFEKLKKFSDTKDAIVQNEKTLENYFPEAYKKEDTEWESIFSDIKCFISIKKHFSGLLNKKIRNLLLSREATAVFADIPNELTDSHAFLDSINELFTRPIDESCLLSDSINCIIAFLEPCHALIGCYDILLQFALSERSWEDVDRDIALLEYIQNTREYYKENESKLTSKYKYFFNGVETDWNGVLEQLAYARDFKKYVDENKLSDRFIKNTCQSKTAANELERMNNLLNRITQLDTYISFIKSLFDPSFDVLTADFDDVYFKLLHCIENMNLLEKQIDYRITRQNCVDCSLESFIIAIECLNETIGDIPSAFLKGFYERWLDFAMEQIPAVSEFRERVQNDRIGRFCELDTVQLQIAQMRIREKIISAFPSKGRFLVAGDELSILSRELDKKKRHMPLRKLFRSIPNLLLKLKPCLMMSPLSVSYFLEAETYKFDMVIFDEASQIFPEDAIGAICRGKQVIIAGDSKQLPPTNFFSASSGGIYDGTETDDDSNEYDIISDSILEEAKNLPNQPLLWHYRSRHESLISFSNKEIYKNKLITFPGSMNRVVDMGVEYVYVEDGVYEGQNNVKEAQKCVELILEHIQKYPRRSLGIIAFSEKQQSAIEDCVERFRFNNPRYEWFFNEEQEEPFFIKNLENVQGDERDTIIFSICYGKNSNGQMFMRFGPLGQSGGERRLNVAITRAKYNIKLIGSILPSDVDLNRTKSDGVRLLRSYIEFAMYATDAEIRSNKNNSLNDDLFCKSVAEFLDSKGYSIVRNIGCSDYTIDIGIEKVDLPGYFAAGIECDGNMYVLAKTASDRDRLRTSILKSMGWNLYRVWSTDWIRNPKEAQAKLLAFVEEAINKPLNVQPKLVPNQIKMTEMASKKSTEAIGAIVETSKQNRIGNKPVELDMYVVANWWEVSYPPNAGNMEKIMALITHVVEIEQPIHRDLIYQRLAGAFGNQKATSTIRRNIDPYLNHMQKQELIKCEDGFFSLQSRDKIPMRKAGGRSIEHISVSEIAAVMIVVSKNAYGLSADALASETAKLFGFERKGPKIVTAMNLTIDYLKSKGAIRIVDDKIQVVEE